MKGEGGDIQPALPGSLTGKERKRKGLAQGECRVLGLGVGGLSNRSRTKGGGADQGSGSDRRGCFLPNTGFSRRVGDVKLLASVGTRGGCREAC